MQSFDATTRRLPTNRPVSPAARYFQDVRRADDMPTAYLAMHAEVPGSGPAERPVETKTQPTTGYEFGGRTAPHWFDLLSEHGQAPLSQAETDLHVQHGWPLPGQEPERPSRLLVYIFAGLAILVALLAIGITLQRNNVLPVGVPVLGKDSGVAACEAIAKGATPTGTDADKEFTATDYQRARQVFADSRYPAIRDNGTRLMDLAWQIQGAGTSDDDLAGALIFMRSLSDAYTGLAGGCADHGVTIPAMTGGN